MRRTVVRRGPARRRVAGAAAVLVLLATAGCGGQAASPPSTGSPGHTAVRESAETADFAKADGARVAGLSTTTFVDEGAGIRAEVPTFADARVLTTAMEVLRERALREASWAGADRVDVRWEMLATGPDALGVLVHSSWQAGGRQTTQSVSVWYDAMARQAYSSPVLIDEERWGSFKDAVARLAEGSRGIDEVKLSRALDSSSAPQGTGPTLGFDPAGNLIVQFADGVFPKGPARFVMDAGTVGPLLSDFGRRAQTASVSPAPFSGAVPAASPSPKATASPEGGRTSNEVPRPSVAVGVDCGRTTCVALTFDDGPAESTREVLRQLHEARVPGTFFAIGRQVEAYPEITREAAAAGHEIGSKSMTHANLTSASSAKLDTEIEGAARTFEGLLGRRPMLMRPPYGNRNDRVDEAIAASGAATILWDVDTLDWKERTPEGTAKGALAAEDKPGSVVLSHDIYPWTAAAVPQMAEGLRRAGVTLVTVSELSLHTGGYEQGRPYCSAADLPQLATDCVR